MQAKAARDLQVGRQKLAFAVLAVIAAASAASAAERLPDAGKHVVRPGKTAAPMSHCASYGEGFVPVVGSDSCVKIGGRLRIDLGGSMAAPVYSGSRDGISPAAHVRVGR